MLLITFQLHAHKYTVEREAPLQHHKKQQTTGPNNDMCVTILKYILQLLGCQGGGGGAATNIKVCSPSHKRLWNINGCVVLFLPLTPYLIHPTLLHRCPPSPTARTSRTRSRRSHFLFFITGTCCLLVCFIIKRLRSGIFSLDSAPVASSASSSQSGSVTAYTSGPSSTLVKKN